MKHKKSLPQVDHEDAPVILAGTRKCRYCGRLFYPAKNNLVCCSWDCQALYQEAEAELEQYDDDPDYEHPF